MRCTFVLPVLGDVQDCGTALVRTLSKLGSRMGRIGDASASAAAAAAAATITAPAHHVALDTNAADVAQKTKLGKQEQRHTAMLQVLT